MWSGNPDISCNMCPKERSSDPIECEQCDTDPAERTLLLRYAGPTLISLTRSPFSIQSLTLGTEMMERK